MVNTPIGMLVLLMMSIGEYLAVVSIMSAKMVIDGYTVLLIQKKMPKKLKSYFLPLGWMVTLVVAMMIQQQCIVIARMFIRIRKQRASCAPRMMSRFS